MNLTRPDERFIAQAVKRCRPDWDEGGIITGLRRANDLEKPPDFATLLEAAIRYANARTDDGRPRWSTPAFQMPGEHWSGTVIAKRRMPSMCGEHPEMPATKCPHCTRTPTGEPPSVDWRGIAGIKPKRARTDLHCAICDQTIRRGEYVTRHQLKDAHDRCKQAQREGDQP